MKIYTIAYLMKFLIALLCSCLFSSFLHAQQKSIRPKVGLTLSGGGAKGLAHIGILKAIDSAGLKIDYITGTSMGGIIGALYAVGYSGDELEKIVKEIDWDVLFSNQIPLQMLSMEEKEQQSRFAAELPYINNKIKLPAGVIKGQELNLKFSELFFHVYNVNRFNEFNIPFQCMATDLETGNLVVLDSGHITTAMRATMAIPSIFSAITINNKKLVDGGLARNFPVKNVKQMGADIVIGSNVSSGLTAKEKITNPVDVILQMAFFKEAGDFKEELPLTDTYIYMPLEKYNMSSFGSSREILNEGLRTGRLYYPQFKKLADSLDALEKSFHQREKAAYSKSIYIKELSIEGLSKTSPSFFTHLMDFYDHRYYTAEQIGKSIRKAYGSNYYNSITYTLQPLATDTAKIIFSVEENPGTYLKAGLYYTRFRGINVNLNLTTRDFIIPNSRSMVSLSLGESTQIELEHLQYLGRKKNLALIPGFDLESLDINTYDHFNIDGAYKQVFYKGFFNFQNSGNHKLAIGIGTSFEYTHYRPVISSKIDIKGNFTAIKSYTYIKYNTANQIFYPTKGMRISAELGQVYHQRPHITILENGIPINQYLNFANYSRLVFDGVLFVPVNPRLNFFTEMQAGINFTDHPNVLNNFYIGGINGNFRNQIRFAGLREAATNASSAVALLLGLRYMLFNNIYIIGRANGLVKDFLIADKNLFSQSALSGYALTFAYKTPIGPLELSAMYSDQSRKLQSYVLFGITF